MTQKNTDRRVYSEEELSRLDDVQFARALRGQNPGPASERADLSATRTPEAEEAEIKRRLLRRSGLADLSGGPAGRELSDEEMLRGLQARRDGKETQQVGLRRAVERQAEDLGWSLRSHRSGEVIPDDHREQLTDLGFL